MQNQVQKGEAINVVTPSGGMVSGNGYLIGSMFGIAALTSVVGAANVLWLRGVYTLIKNSAEAWTVGELIYWDNTHDWLTSSSASGVNKLVGVATAAAANPSASGTVRLNGVFIS